MSRTFTPCRGKTACQEDDKGCRVCGRDSDEINRTRRLIEDLAVFALDMNYSNLDEFAEYIANKVVKKVQYRQQQEAAAAHVDH